MKRNFIFFFLVCCIQHTFAQPVLLEVLKPNRDKLFRNIVRNTINSNLTVPLSDSSEDKWEDAFRAIEFLAYRSPWIDKKINFAFGELPGRTVSFQRSLLELGFAVYPAMFNTQVRSLLLQTSDVKVFAMCANYILKTDSSETEKRTIHEIINQKLLMDSGNPILEQLLYQITNTEKNNTPSIHTLLQKNYLPGHVLIISFQRTNRNYPGLVLVRDAKGNFLTEAYGNYFSVPQLARSITCLHG